MDLNYVNCTSEFPRKYIPASSLRAAHPRPAVVAFPLKQKQEERVRISLRHFALVGFVLACCLGLVAQSPAPAAASVAKPAVALPAAEQQPVTNPLADPKAVVVLGHARFSVLTPQLIRMEWAADGKFEDHASFVFLNRRMPVPKFSQALTDNGHTLTIKTTALTLTYTLTPDGRFLPGNLSIALTVDGKSTVWFPGHEDPDNLQGTTRTLDGANGDKIREPIEPGLVSRSGWALVDDSTRPLFDSADFRFLQGEKSPWPWAMQRPAGDRQDWYFFGYGHDYRQALGDFVKVAGRIPLPPRFAFGAWWSRYWDYTDQELDELISGFRQNDIPLDVLVIDMGWHISNEQLKTAGEVDQSNHPLGWTGYSWNKVLFPDPDEFLQKIHAEGLKATLNLHPASGIEPWETAYPAMAKAMGIDPATRKFIAFDIADKKFAANYMSLVHHPLEKQGIDFWWLDWQQEQHTSMPGVMPTWWLNYVHFTDQQREGKRPLLFHRWGGLGNHRYQIGFSGDTHTSWQSLAYQPWFTATAANVGYAYWSHDIGGHIPGGVEPELYTRWVQFGAFSPILRTHTTKNPDAERRVWAYPEPYSSILRSTFQLRYALEPYTYTEARRTYDTGIAFMRPLYYDWPNEDAAYTAKGEYIFGDQMLAAPVTTPADKLTGLATEHIFLPRGDWYEWPTGRRLTGPVTMDRSFSIDQTPIYLKAGAIVPMQPPMLYTGQKPVDPLIVNVWPMAVGASSTYQVYEDSGAAVDYQKGIYARTPVKASQTADTLRVEIGPVEGNYPGSLQQRGYELRLPADWPPSSVTVNSVAVRKAGVTGKGGWSFSGNTLTTIVPVPSASVSAKVTIEVRRAPGLIGRRGQLDGFAGAMTRLRAAYDAMQQTWPIAAPPDTLIDAMQTGDRLTYHPERVAAEITRFHETIMPKAQSDLAGIVDSMSQRFKDNTRRLGATPAEVEAQKQRRMDAVKKAQLLLAEIEK